MHFGLPVYCSYCYVKIKKKKTLNHTELDIFVTRVSSENIVFFILKSKIWILYDICQTRSKSFYSYI